MKRAIVVGCGLSGAVVARELAEAGWKVDIYERRNHIGGNMYDFVDEHGILVHKYGPHTFHTHKKELFDYVSKFCEWQEYRLHCGAVIDGICTPTPFNFKTIDQFYSKADAEILKQEIRIEFPERESASVLEVLECTNDIVRRYAEFLFQKDYSLYTAKQWGIEPSDIDTSVLKRVPLRFNYEEGYFDDKYQIMPKKSYTVFFEELLNHKNIDIYLEFEALNHLSVASTGIHLEWNGDWIDCPVVYTGAIDELFKHCDGVLPYRSLHFEWRYDTCDSVQDMAVVAYPQAEAYTRIVEFKKIPQQNTKGTSYEIEYPLKYTPGQNYEPYYPVLTKSSTQLYLKYIEKVEKISNLYCCGRLADFQYYNMDQALEVALMCARKILKEYNCLS